MRMRLAAIFRRSGQAIAAVTCADEQMKRHGHGRRGEQSKAEPWLEECLSVPRFESSESQAYLRLPVGRTFEKWSFSGCSRDFD